MITKQQYRKLMNNYQETGNVSNSALRADVSRPTARKYIAATQTPQELQVKHTWRTREDALGEIWPQAEAMLAEAPDLEAKTLFEYLWERSPWAAQEKHLRTFQRRVKLWRLRHGPDQEVFFPQDWEAGRALQMDWTHAAELAIVRVISGSPAEEAGLRANDRILAVNGVSTKNVPTEQAANMLQGEEGTTVALTVAAPGQSPRAVAVRRFAESTQSHRASSRHNSE